MYWLEVPAKLEPGRYRNITGTAVLIQQIDPPAMADLLAYLDSIR